MKWYSTLPGCPLAKQLPHLGGTLATTAGKPHTARVYLVAPNGKGFPERSLSLQQVISFTA
jgi:hypothetical protein